jgi:Protein of unknown function (DUF3987)
MSEDSALRFLALLNVLWDGGTFDRERETRASAHVSGRRFTSGLMLQPATLAKLASVGGGIARGVGALARFLVAWPTTTMGGRDYRAGDLDSPELRAFDARLTELLNVPLPLSDAGEIEPPALRLSAEGFAVWRTLHDDVEHELCPRGEFGDLTDIGAKIAEQAARLACVLHVFQHGPRGEIGPDMMMTGAKIAAWHLIEARRVFAILGQVGEAADAQLLLDWLLEQTEAPTLGNILRLGPYRLRDKKRRDGAAKMLVEHNLARVVKRGDAEYLTLSPAAKKS